jgi:hypothetical protein
LGFFGLKTNHLATLLLRRIIQFSSMATPPPSFTRENLDRSQKFTRENLPAKIWIDRKNSRRAPI